MSERANLKEFEKIKRAAEQLKIDHQKAVSQMDEATDAYWLETSESMGGGKDPKAVKLTVGPTPHNMVKGGVRLMTATDPVFKAEAHGEGGAGSKDEVENAARLMWMHSCARRRSPVHVDAARSALLWSDVHIVAKCVKDMLAQKNISKQRKARLEALMEETPYLFECVNPGTRFPRFDDLGALTGYLQVRKLRGDKAEAEYGMPNADPAEDYVIWDWYGETLRMVWPEGENKPLDGYNGEHELEEIPVAVTFSDGSELFPEEERKRQGFLFGYLKTKLWQRETLALTTLFTSMYERGSGPLVAIDPDGLDGNTVEVNWAGAMRYIVGKAHLLNDKAFDNDLVQALSLIGDMSAESLLYKQALGQPLGGSGTAFSTVALLSQAGRLPLVSPTEAVGAAIGQIVSIAVRRIGKENLAPTILKTTDIPEKFTLTAKLEVKLPQDQLRNAQIAQTLTEGEYPKVSNEWVQQEILGVTDSGAMNKQIFKERYLGMRFMEYARMMMAQAQQMEARGAGGMQPGAPGGENMPPGGENMPPGGEGISPEMAMAGGEQMPMTEPMPAGDEREVRRGRP